jgi:hypothetical protein
MAGVIEIEDLEEHYRCKHCGSKLLVKIYDNRYIASSDFLTDFPGWCHTCLVEHCLKTSCRECTVRDNEECSFSYMKEYYMSVED